eukprot:1161772-Pelagomonas_calceolata.AAC.2
MSSAPVNDALMVYSLGCCLLACSRPKPAQMRMSARIHAHTYTTHICAHTRTHSPAGIPSVLCTDRGYSAVHPAPVSLLPPRRPGASLFIVHG